MKRHMDHEPERVVDAVGGVTCIHTHMQTHMYTSSTSQFYVAQAHFLRDGNTTLPPPQRKPVSSVTEKPRVLTISFTFLHKSEI